MKVFVEKDNQQLEIQKPCTGKELLKELGINASTVLLIKNGDVVLEDEDLSIEDDIRILSVISGG
ncbi:MoaD/ThiS family protein [Candidatus Woesearchaeota archaeon]|nr:MoaD/ThiS family protein [Candidatus Woesearchaeota archaeon]